MGEVLRSVGVDIGTSTTQLVLSRLTLENRATAFSVPRVAITEKEIVYRSGIHFTPLLSETRIDADGVRAIVAEEYRKAGAAPGDIQTGAVIITGETARKENAREVLTALAGFAGDFVVATAGPDLESILAARGAGIPQYSKDNRCKILHFDIGGGTSNLALYDRGELKWTKCLNVGGRLVKIDPRRAEITHISRNIAGWPPDGAAYGGAEPVPGQRAEPHRLQPLIEAMTEALAAVIPEDVKVLSFSGGVADCIWSPPQNWLEYGDVGPLLAARIKSRFEGAGYTLVRGSETIRATVVGAGAHSTDLSGSTIFYRGVEFPLQNLPIVKLEPEECGEKLPSALAQKLSWFADEEGMSQVAVALRGARSPSYDWVKTLAGRLAEGLKPLLAEGHFPILVVEEDLAKALGQTLYPLLPGGKLICLDGISVAQGDYIDLMAPAYGGTVLPVVVKTLAFEKAE